MTLRVLAGTGLVGIATVRALGSQPRRNRERRRLHEIVRLARATDHPDLAQFDLVVSVRATAAQADHLTLKAEFAELWAKVQPRLLGESPEVS
jgi:ribonuclease P protein component